ncbi:MAG: outer membrane beta-barrel protein [Verrucomicrobiae bacterium]|nr:outer membrane beta-barrel protein [Verrucomicrobiae bacterium]
MFQLLSCPSASGTLKLLNTKASMRLPPFSLLLALSIGFSLLSPQNIRADAGETAVKKTIKPDTKEPAAAISGKKTAGWFNLDKPEEVTELGLVVKEFFDSNIYVTKRDNPAMGNRSSWINSITPRAGFNFAPLIEDGVEKDRILKSLSLNYAPEVSTYGSTDTESNTAHRVVNRILIKADNFTFQADNSFFYINGCKDGPIYVNGVNAVAGSWIRERREQIQDRARITLRCDWNDFFIRPTASLLYYDFLTNHQNDSAGFTPGYQNYVDRYDTNGGVDLGFKLNKDFAFFAGYRYGHQYQGIVPWLPVTFSSDYQRILGGFEGKPFKWLKTHVLAGPDFRNYDDPRTPASFRAGDNSLKLFADGSATAEITRNDTMTLRASNFQWVSGTGRATYEEKIYQWSYTRKLIPELSSEIGVRAIGYDYDFPSIREDWVHTCMAGLRYQYNANLSVNLDYSCDQGVNEIDGNNFFGREFYRHIVALTLKFKL